MGVPPMTAMGQEFPSKRGPIYGQGRTACGSQQRKATGAESMCLIRLCSNAPRRSDSNVRLDVGCGEGRFCRMLRRKASLLLESALPGSCSRRQEDAMRGVNTKSQEPELALSRRQFRSCRKLSDA